MATILERLAKRRCYPVQLGEETLYCRALTLGELDALKTLPEELAAAFGIGCGLVNDDGSQAIPRLVVPAVEGTPATTEPNTEFARRVDIALQDVGLDQIIALTEAIRKLNTVPPMESLRKN